MMGMPIRKTIFFFFKREDVYTWLGKVYSIENMVCSLRNSPLGLTFINACRAPCFNKFAFFTFA